MVCRQRRVQVPPSPDLERRLDALEPRVDALTDEIPAGFERGPKEIAQIRSESAGAIKSARKGMHGRMEGLRAAIQTVNGDLCKTPSLNEKPMSMRGPCH